MVGIGTASPAGDETNHLLPNLRMASLAHRIGREDHETWPTVRELLWMATRGSAGCLGRDDLGVIEPGRSADIACWDLDTIDRVGVQDPLIGLVSTGLSSAATLVIVNGEALVEGGALARLDTQEITRTAQSALSLDRDF